MWTGRLIKEEEARWRWRIVECCFDKLYYLLPESLYNTGRYVCVVDIKVEKLLRIEITYNLERLLGFIMVADYGFVLLERG